MSILYGTFPEPIEVSEDRTGNQLVVQTRYHEAVHDLARGGVIRSIRYVHGTDRNLLVHPMACSVVTAGADSATFSDLHETTPEVSCHKEDDAVLLRVHGIRVATYFSNKELHPTTKAYREHGEKWGGTLWMPRWRSSGLCEDAL